MKYYKLDRIKKRKAQYNMIFGERSSGKTFAVLEEILKNYTKTKKQGVIIRRWDDDYKKGRGSVMFANLVSTGKVTKYTNGAWTDIYFKGRAWYLCRYDEEQKRIIDERPIAYALSLTGSEHDKSTSYPEVTTILFDEFLSRTMYLPDEFILFCNTISTVIRGRNDVTIYMCGNTINKYCPYFIEMGLKHVKQMKAGDLDVYQYGDSGLTVAVEYTLPNAKGKDSDIYFAFNNPKLQMITTGAWELDIYPHLPRKYKPKHVLFHFYVQFDGQYLHAEIISVENSTFIYVYPKNDEIKNPERDYVYTTEYSDKPNIRRNILKPTNKIDRKIYDLFKNDKVFYADNECGEIMRNYCNWCKQN